jgi:hypothetical protein
LNFFAFNLLFFALYLNFIHKDTNFVPVTTHEKKNGGSGTELVENQDMYLQHSNNNISEPSSVQDKTAAMKISFH